MKEAGPDEWEVEKPLKKTKGRKCLSAFLAFKSNKKQRTFNDEVSKRAIKRLATEGVRGSAWSHGCSLTILVEGGARG